VATSTGGYQGINVATIEPSSTVSILRNQIYNLNTSAANILLGITSSPLANSGTLIVRNNSISIGSAAFLNTGSQNIRCFTFGGAAINATVIVENNTFRVGGIHVTANGQPTSMAALKSNAGTGSSFTFKNNLCINTRTGSANQHVGLFVSTPTTGTNVVDYNTIWGGPNNLYAAWLGTFYGTEAAYRAAAFPNEQNSTMGNVAFINDSTPVLATGNSAKLVVGTPLASVPTDMFGTARSLTDPFRGAYESLTPLDSMDASVVIIYTYGKIPVGTDDTVRAIIRNNGTRAINGLYVKLTGTASNFADSILVNLSRFSDTTVYLSPYTPSVLGRDTLKAIITSDQNASNNVSTWLRENTLNALAYTQTSLPRSGNVGTTGEGEIVAKFYTPVPNFVNQVNVDFTNPGFVQPFPFQVVIYLDSGAAGPKSVPFWVSATQSTVNGVFNLSLPSVPVTGNFYIGVRQTTSNNIGFAFQTENPIRNKTFFFRQGVNYQNLAWNDFAVNPANAFRFMIEPRLKINDDLGVIDLNAPGIGCANLGIQAVKFRVQNLGLLTQNFAIDNLALYGFVKKPSGTTFNFGPVTTNSGSLVSDDHIDVDLTGNFNFDSVGTYTFKAWTVFGPDNNKINDTLPELQRTIFTANTIPFAQNFNAALAVPGEWVAGRFFVNANTGNGGTNSMRVGINNTNTFSANASLRSPRISNVNANTVLRFDYRIINNVGGTAATLINTDSVKIMVSTDCGNTFTLTNLINGTNHISSAAYTTYEVSLGAYAGNDVVIKIMLDWFGTTNDAVVDIDNVRVVDGANDMGVASVNNPCRSVILGSSSFAPQVTVANYGSAAQTGVNVNVSITGPVNYTGSFTIPSLAGKASAAVNMSTLFNPSTAGTYTLKTWTSLANDGDASNDTLVRTFNVTDIALGNTPVNALTFGAAQSRVNVTSSPTLNVSSGLTVEAWINRTAGGATRSIITKDSAVGFIQYALELNDTNALRFTIFTTTGFFVFTSSIIVPTGYNHVAATYNGSKVLLYINGAIVGNGSVTSGTMLSFNYDLRIGNNNLFTSAFGGAIDELRIWNVGRTENDIRTNLHTRLANASSTDLVAYYRMDEATGNTFITDASGNCNAGTFAATLPSRTVASYPLGIPAVATQTVSFDGYQFLTGTDVVIYFSSFAGVDTIYAHKFSSAPIGTSAATSPGGVTAVYPGYWMFYKYGTGTFSGTTSTVEFTLGNGNLLSSVNTNDLKLFSRVVGSTGGWTVANTSATAASFANQTVQYTLAASTFNNGLSIGANNNPLPVELLRLSGAASKADAVLHWATATETNNKGFAVERSLDGKTFAQVDFVSGAGNSSRVNNYSYADRNIFATTQVVYYRLKQVDFNENYTYTDVVLVRVDQVVKPQVVVYPNPVRDVLSVEVDALTNGSATVTITDITGKLVRSVDMSLT
ncbi:MAG: LamG-like jellyroll fold domain-containing protein, partial [Bacteroidota bacterium]